jgi:predicted PurR-regulated permease PerM
MSDETPRPGSRFVLVPLIVTLLVIAYLAFLVFRPFLLTFTVAASVALMLTPAHRRLTLWFGHRAGLGAGLLVLLVSLVILLPITAAAGLVGNQAVAFFEWARHYLQPRALEDALRELVVHRAPWLQAWIHTDRAGLSRLLSSALAGAAQGAQLVIQLTAMRLTTAVFELVLFVLMLFFLLRDGATLRRWFREISPLSEAQESSMVEHLSRTVKGVMLAMIVVPLVQGFMAFFGFLLVGVPAPLLWSVFVVLAALIPVLGSPLGWVPAVIYLFLEGAGLSWLWMLLYGVFGISTIDNFVKPWLLREAARIHPMLGFLSIVGGALAFGPMGFLIGPVILSLVLSAVTIYHSDIVRHARAAEQVSVRGD